MKKLFQPFSSLLQRTYNWTLSWAQHPHSKWVLFVLAFAESSFFPIPPDVLLIALAMGAHKKSFRFALICSVGSILGGMFGYWIGYQFFTPLAQPIIELFHLQENMAEAKTLLNDHGVGIILIAGFSPIPYKVFTIASGWAQMNFTLFVIASAISRSARFYLVASLFYFLGPSAKSFIDRYFEKIVIWVTVLMILATALYLFLS